VRQSAASAPLVVRNISMRAVVAMATAAAAHMGSAEVAAHQVAFTTYIMLSLVLDAVAIAGQALVGRYLGAGDVAGARAATQRMIELSIATGLITGITVLVTRSLITPLFTEDQEVQRLLVSALLVLALVQPLGGWVYALDGVLLGAGDVRYIALGQAWRRWSRAAALAGELDLGLSSLWWAIGVWLLARLVVMAIREHGEAWAVTGGVR
jgi:Na+-driven multidrug efflux pump